jgi:hypothetical protein
MADDPRESNKEKFAFLQAVQGCQIVYFETKNGTLGNLGGLTMEDVFIIYGHLVYFTAISYILWIFANLYIFPHVGILYKEKSGNPVAVE